MPRTTDQQRAHDAARKSRRHPVRPKTENLTRLTKRRQLSIIADAMSYPDYVTRPKTRGDCRCVPRPCPFVSCKWNMYLDINQHTGSVQINFPDLEPSEMKESCALDVADRGGTTLEDVGVHMNVTRERIRQIELAALGQAFRARYLLGHRVELGTPDERRLTRLEEATLASLQRGARSVPDVTCSVMGSNAPGARPMVAAALSRLVEMGLAVEAEPGKYDVEGDDDGR